MWGSDQVCPMIFMLRWRSFNEKNTHTCEKVQLKSVKGKILKITSFTHYHNSQEQKHDSYGDL